jgi:hypothetical protein
VNCTCLVTFVFLCYASMASEIHDRHVYRCPNGRHGLAQPEHIPARPSLSTFRPGPFEPVTVKPEPLTVTGCATQRTAISKPARHCTGPIVPGWPGKHSPWRSSCQPEHDKYQNHYPFTLDHRFTSHSLHIYMETLHTLAHHNYMETLHISQCTTICKMYTQIRSIWDHNYR